ncbi:dicarboxylate/amino acid:cation symporter [Neisseria sp. Ec49-e6-T10]|uniref:dicarboxylate/amino acid:cation symporter n=1 Tax=Neisseria sp. Ec49-e6-T10 TaxID=3140744 RepID=UPI003EB8D719
MQKTPFYKILYVQVIFAIVVGILLGHYFPAPENVTGAEAHWSAVDLKPLGDAFIKLIKMVIGPIIFCTVVTGIAGIHDMKQVGKVGAKALLYFEIVSTFALVIGLMSAHFFGPGVGMNIDPSHLNTKDIEKYTHAQHDGSLVDFLMSIIPNTLFSAFVDGNILQILLVAILFGAGLSRMGKTGAMVFELFEKISHVLFAVIGFITKLAPIGALGAMAFTIGKYGISALGPMLELILTFYFTAIVFVIVVLGAISYYVGFNIFKFIAYIKEELMIVLGTSSSESALPQLMRKLEHLGCAKPVVGLVIPTGYSFNLDGTNIYMTMAVLFIAQATNTDLSLLQQITILGVAMISSKGASGVTGAGFITLAATLAVVPDIPIAGMVLILGIDRFMSECRALTNITGNAVAAVVVSAWEKALDKDRMHKVLNKEIPFENH